MHIITYLLIFPTNKISEGQFLAESIVNMLAWSNKLIPLYFIVL